MPPYSLRKTPAAFSLTGHDHAHSDLTGVTSEQHHASVTLSVAANTFLSVIAQEISLDSQAANTVLAGPTSGGNVVPAFRVLVSADLPASALQTTGSYVATGTYDFGGSVSLELPNSTTPTVNANGEIAIDTSVADFSHGIVRYYGGEELGVVAMPSVQFLSPQDGYVVAYNATTDEFNMVAQSGGVTDHGALTGLTPDDDHTHYALLAGRSGEQTLYGDTANNGNLTLGGTSSATHATSIISMLDHVRLASGKVIQDSAGGKRITLATSLPHVLLTGDVHVTGNLGVGDVPTTSPFVLVYLKQTIGTVAADFFGVRGIHTITSSLSSAVIAGYSGQLAVGASGGSTGQLIHGLEFAAYASGSVSGAELSAIYVQIGRLTGSPNVTNAHGLWVDDAFMAGGTFVTVYGVRIGLQGRSTSTTVYGLQIADQTVGTNKYVIEAGPATPYFRVVGNWTTSGKGANLTPIYISEGATPTLRQLKTFDPGNLGVNFTAGQLVCVLV